MGLLVYTPATLTASTVYDFCLLFEVLETSTVISQVTSKCLKPVGIIIVRLNQYFEFEILIYFECGTWLKCATVSIWKRHSFSWRKQCLHFLPWKYTCFNLNDKNNFLTFIPIIANTYLMMSGSIFIKSLNEIGSRKGDYSDVFSKLEMCLRVWTILHFGL